MFGMAQKLDDLKAELDNLDQLLRTMRAHTHNIYIKVIDPVKSTVHQMPLVEFTDHVDKLQDGLIRHLANKFTAKLTRYLGIKSELQQRSAQNSKLTVVHRNPPASFLPEIDV